MNVKTFVKEITTLSAATAVLKVSTLANRLAVSEIQEATRQLKSSTDLPGTKRAMKHYDRGIKHAKNGQILRTFALSIHPAPTN